jgi:hypothetical protein
LDHDRLLAGLLFRRVAEQLGDAVYYWQQRRGARIRRWNDEGQHYIRAEHGPDHAVHRLYFSLVQQTQGNAPIQPRRLHQGRKQKRRQAQKYHRRGKATGCFRKFIYCAA